MHGFLSPKSALYGTMVEAGGRRFRLEPRLVEVVDGASARVPSGAAEAGLAGPCLVLFDARTRAAAGAAALAALRDAGIDAAECLLPDPPGGGDPACDEAARDFAKAALGGRAWMLAVGSGVVNDVAKWAAAESGVPYMVLATAASMNGYASANVAATVRGVKTLRRAEAPRAVLADPAVLAAAPRRLTTAGFGDILAKSVSSADWLLNHLLFGDEFLPECVDLVAGIEPLYAERPEAIRDGDPAAIRALFEGLLLTGVAMTLAGTSSPASGGEHLVSHALDMMSAIDGGAHDLHGRQVGVGVVLASALYEELFALPSLGLDPSPGAIDPAFWGPLAGEVAACFEQKRARYAQAADAFQRDASLWPEFKRRAAPMLRQPQWVSDALRRAGGAWRAEDLGMAPERVLAAFVRGREMRERFTVLDLAWMAGILPGRAEAIMRRWAA